MACKDIVGCSLGARLAEFGHIIPVLVRLAGHAGQLGWAPERALVAADAGNTVPVGVGSRALASLEGFVVEFAA